MEYNVQEMIFQFIGGLGIFLFGIKYMGDGLQQAAGDRLRDILDRFTTNPLMGVLAGMLVTVLIQSSSGTTALTVGLVSAGFMTLRQAIGVIMGANIGTTVTAFIIGIKIGEYALPVMAVGAILLFFFKNKKVHSVGQVVFGFGMLFFGLELMSAGMKPLRSLEAFQDLMISMSDNPILGIIVGTVFTLIVQSSSATIGILQELFGQDAIDLQAALPVLFGDNIGTTITAVLAAIGTSIAARRAALVHVIFNIIGTIIFTIILIPFTNLIQYFQTSLNLNPEMTIAFAHGTFNVTNTIIQFPFIAVLAWIVTKIIRGEDASINFKPQHLNPIFIEQSPAIALTEAQKEIIRMAEFSLDGLKEANQFLNTQDKKHANMATQLEGAINNLDKKITEYLVLLSEKPLSSADSEKHSVLAGVVGDIERVGDHVENLVELVDFQISNRVSLSDDALTELNEMLELTISTLQDAINALTNFDTELAQTVIAKERKIDQMERVLRKRHVIRLNERSCSGDASIIFVDMVSNLERIGDHAVNIADGVLGEQGKVNLKQSL
ncbi:Na/Pi cotransporter family protein [Bacillus toyonensis]|uniref:Na/Pi cotransporter family protein n=1 Tax=Bacillus toyonensis TaxID=155322 RepID=UPI000B448BC3|nr:Na/Pi cotransporter family protein [Bacillus toyonensis]OTX28344.1 sodium:phosphate symporter [Bacillus thuringiensis serovar malayensis]OUB04453.1 sodium:phosphate symporter [Bacillus thuringiensis serovar shandongiensis]MBX0354473.1 Na/Pi cotransporter family protein [Bacillus toyonensis]MDM5257497.1 Na/Pi cotransporter family protein [Bacillus toyonensis]MEC2392271.1 Na/Pi cotransporter family protein [Bacillus toyonensis]